jgi:ATP-binding cassette subfamily F protein 3
MLFPRNVLVLDEPTNHLDIPARETLEGALTSYEGTLLVVSHDRYFLDRICTRLLVIEGTGLEAHLGNYSDWRRRKREDASRAAEKAAAVEKAAAETRGKAAAPASAPRAPAESEATRAANKERERERRRLERRVETLEADVGKLEGELQAVRQELAGDHAGDWQKLHTLADRERELDALLARRMAEWETASSTLAKTGSA